MDNYKSPIGIFDSGYGGLTVLEEVHKLLPEYDYLYLGDNARAPYGTRSFEVVFEYTWECVQLLFARGCDLVILACNTASAKALRKIQQEHLKDFPGKRVLGVIRPMAEVVGILSDSMDIGVFATEGTVKSNSYKIEIAHFFPDIMVHQFACPLWVPIIENDKYDKPEGIEFIKRDLERFRMDHPEVKTIILACTHYPIIADLLKKLAPEVNFISQGAVVAASLADYLKRHTWLEKSISKKGQIDFLTTEDPEIFETSVANILKRTIKVNHIKTPAK